MTGKKGVILKRLTVGKILLIFLIIYIGFLVLPYVCHKKVPASYQESFDVSSFYGSGPGPERTAYIDNNDDALLWRLRLIEEAREEIILSTFDFKSDEAGKDIIAALMQASDRGVQVRVIVDGFNGVLKLTGNKYFKALVSCPGVSIKIYNPISPFRPWDMQARLHDKYLIIDNSMYMLGGRNTMELFLGDYSPEKNVDRELFVYETKQPDENASISQLRRYFETVWALPDSREYVCRKKTSSVEQADKELRERYEYLRETYSEAYTDWDFTALTMETNRISLLSNPIETENKEPLLWYSLQQLMQEADQVTMYTPYIICGKEMYQGLEELKNRGVSVEMITNDVASGANPWGCTDYLNQKEKIWDTGVKVYELMGEYSSHTKAVLLDSRMSLVGSYNFDMRSTYQDTELMLAVDCPELNRIICQEAERDKAKSKIMGANGEYQYGEGYVPREMSPGKKIFYAIMRVLVIPLRRFL